MSSTGSVIKMSSGVKLFEGEKLPFDIQNGYDALGTLILTEKRLIFAEPPPEKISKKKRIAAVLTAGPLTTPIWEKKLSEIKPEDLEKVLSDPQTLTIPLQDIVEARSRRKWGMTAYLTIKHQMGANSFVFGMGMKGTKDWVKAINDAKAQ